MRCGPRSSTCDASTATGNPHDRRLRMVRRSALPVGGGGRRWNCRVILRRRSWPYTRSCASVIAPSPRIVSLATAVPPPLSPKRRRWGSSTVSSTSRPHNGSVLKGVFVDAEIETRYAAAPVEWYEQAHGFEEKKTKYIDTAVNLLKQVAVESVAGADLECKDIDTIVTVSTTGIAVTSLDARLMEELPARRNVQRLPVFGLGCAGGVLGLARAAACARPAGQPGPVPGGRSSAPSRSVRATGPPRTSSPPRSSETAPPARC